MKARVLMTTRSFRIVVHPSSGRAVLEERDGCDAMGVQRWRRASIDTDMNVVVNQIGVSLLTRERRARGRRQKAGGAS